MTTATVSRETASKSRELDRLAALVERLYSPTFDHLWRMLSWSAFNRADRDLALAIEHIRRGRCSEARAAVTRAARTIGVLARWQSEHDVPA